MTAWEDYRVQQNQCWLPDAPATAAPADEHERINNQTRRVRRYAGIRAERIDGLPLLR
jgi:hypothetical protein